jgi:TetR/AcrR family fatty acid metabolism transcriptional regulator
MVTRSLRVEETRRDRRIQRQRKAIMEAAASLFAKKGYLATTTKDIAQCVDVGESTLYGYFSSKQEVLEAILRQQAGIVDSVLDQLNELEGRESFVDLVDLLLEKLLASLLYTRVVIAEAWFDDEVLELFVLTRWQPVLTILQQFIAERVASGTMRPIDPSLGARMMAAVFVGATLPMLRGIEPLPTAQQRRSLAENIVDLLFDGLAIQRG